MTRNKKIVSKSIRIEKWIVEEVEKIDREIYPVTKGNFSRSARELILKGLGPREKK